MLRLECKVYNFVEHLHFKFLFSFGFFLGKMPYGKKRSRRARKKKASDSSPVRNAQTSYGTTLPIILINGWFSDPQLVQNTYLNLEAFYNHFLNLEGKVGDISQGAVIMSDGVKPTKKQPRVPKRNVMPNEYLDHEFQKMILSEENREEGNIHPYGSLFPVIDNIDGNGQSLRISRNDIRDLPIFLSIYILYQLARMSTLHKTMQIWYSLSNTDTDYDTPLRPISDFFRNANLVLNRDGRMSRPVFKQIYLTLLNLFGAYQNEMLSRDPDNTTWTGSQESGTRFMIRNMADGGDDIILSLRFFDVSQQSFSGHWTQKVEDLITKTVGTSVISVRNRKDNMCLIYCIVMGLITKLQPGYNRVFGFDDVMVEDYEVYAKGMYMFKDDDSPVSKLIRRLTQCLMPPEYSEGEINDSLIAYVKEIDKKAGTMMDVSEFKETFAKIEETLIQPKGICGIDVYGMDFNESVHIYPLYVSDNREHVIELLCVTPPEEKEPYSHFCLIVNSDRLFKMSGGKQFFTCSKCGKSYYHRRLLTEHNCTFVEDDSMVEGKGGYHFAAKKDVCEPGEIANYDPQYCTKCRLCFLDKFKYEYHKEHCFMNGKTGFRHVQLITYDKDEHPTLNGEEIDFEAEEKHIANRKVLYADFESSINPETGEHTFMSYGLYDWDLNVYGCGYDLDEFLQNIVDSILAGNATHIYVYFHNAMNYDANFILRHVLKNDKYKDWGIQVIMKSSNKLQKLVFYLLIDKKRYSIHIADTFLFLTLSLDRIVSSIRKDNVEINEANFERFFDIFRKNYPWASTTEIDHILRKNIFPYKFFTDSDKLDTPIDEFYSIFEPKEENLKYFSERVSLNDLRNKYEDTGKVISTFKCKTARDYHDLYLMCDVMQLADVFDRSMNILWASHHIHLTKYLGMPSASWAAFLRHDPEMKIPLYEDTFYAEFFKGMIRGGITSAALRHAEADDKHSIIYLDVNGLYPYVMQKYGFPCGKFQFVPMNIEGDFQCRLVLLNLFETFKKEKRGMCFCVDMHIPDGVKELTDMYPFAPEHRVIFNEYFCDVASKQMTPFLQRWSEANDNETMNAFTGLVCTLYDKEKYNVHWRTLEFYLTHGVVIKKIWFGVSFDEGDYLCGYIRKNIEIRNQRKDELGKTLYKLLGNSIYGKTFESPFKRNTYEIVRDKKKLQGLMENGNISSMVPIDDVAWVVQMNGDDIILDKPTYIGACVCEFSKLHMYTLLYDKLMKIFPGVEGDRGCQLVYTDTDSFIVRVRHPDGVTGDPKSLFGYIKSRDPDLIGGIGGQVKSETGEDDTIQEVIALRSKVYAYITKSGHIGKRAKGTTLDAQELQLDWQTYKQALESLTSIDTKNNQFVRETFKIASVDMFRRSLSVNDGKRYICDDGVHTHAFGHPSLLQE